MLDTWSLLGWLEAEGDWNRSELTMSDYDIEKLGGLLLLGVGFRKTVN